MERYRHLAPTGVEPRFVQPLANPLPIALSRPPKIQFASVIPVNGS